MSIKKFISFIVIAGLFYLHCNRVPITGRRQINLMPEYMLMDMSLTNYNQFLKENKTISGSSDAISVKRVGSRLSKAAEETSTS